jgi:hypothetical protein
MKYLKMLGLAAVAAAALMAFAGPASATQLTSPVGTQLPAGTTIHAVSKGHSVLDSLIGKIECNSTLQGKTSNASGATIEAAISTFTFGACTTATVHVIKSGSLKIASTGGGNGSVTSTGAEWTVVTFGIHCIFSTNNTSIGTITGGNPAVLNISATMPVTGTSGPFCGTSAPWTGSYEITTPNPLFVS